MSSTVTGVGTTSNTTSSSTTKTSTVTGKDEFLQLLTYQLKCQDPLSPTSNQDFTAQLAQFSQLDILTDMRTLMQTQATENQTLAQTISNTALPGLIGKSAKVTSDSVKFDGENPVKTGYNLSGSAAGGVLQIKNAAGNTVRTVELGANQTLKGDNDYTWDGKDSEGNTCPSGNYTLSVTAVNSDGTTSTGSVYSYGTIQSVRFKSEGTVLVINGTEQSLSNVTDISTNG